MPSVALHDFVTAHRDDVIRRCRSKVAARSIPTPTEMEIIQGVPLFLEVLLDALCPRRSSNANTSAIRHQHDLRLQAFTVHQMVHDYGDVGQSITDLAEEMGDPISSEDRRALNRCLDDAMARAVTEYGRERNRSALDRESASGAEPLGLLALELQKLSDTANLAFDVLKTGTAGSAGATGSVLNCSLRGIGALVCRLLAEVRITQGVHRKPFLVSGLIEEIAPLAAVEANAQGITLAVMPVEDGVVVEADRQILAAVVGDVLQNAFESTPPQTTVTLRVVAGAERVLIEVHNECLATAGGNLDELFPFGERSADRLGLGLGLAFTLWGVEANEGRIYARSLPESGYVFTVDVPRLPVHAVASLADQVCKKEQRAS